jgi:uncharacterized membrane protein
MSDMPNEQVLTTVALTLKVAVALVDAAAAVGAKPSVKHPKMAAGNAVLTAFENFIEMTPGKFN